MRGQRIGEVFVKLLDVDHVPRSWEGELLGT